jgi:MFS family permease
VHPVVTEGIVDDAALAAILQPRTGLVLERDMGDGTFTMEQGPLRHYARRVEILPALDAVGHAVRQVVELELAIPYWGWLFATPYRRVLGRLDTSGPRQRPPWWAPPDRLDTQAAVTLAALCLLSLVLGYATALLSQTITFAAKEFHTGKQAQGVALASVRADILLSFPLVALTDRRGRRRIVLLATAAACVITAAGAAVPSLPLLIATQVPARGLLTAGAVIVAVMAAEEMPAGARAYAVSLLSMSGAIGVSATLWLLPLADISISAWRILFALALLGLIPLVSIARNLAETRRFEAPHAEVGFSGHGSRLWLLAISAFLLALFLTPAAQFMNEYLRDDRGFTGTRIALFSLLTGTPGGLGVIIGGRLADVYGRRIVGALAVVVGVGTTIAVFAVAGWPLWAWSAVGSLFGAATVPALGVYGPELFPTSLRGRANGVLGLLGRAGSVIGLLFVGYVSARHGFGVAFALLGVGPALLALLIFTRYPETAHQALEDLNPEDRH